ncbi:nucleotide exchange factor GrpE [Aliifodinibius salipaludis]|uniref:Protein GrpE n=1 Tax=Fodinibius salipaludis TaxID=2032627 RepID=A0A2A2GDM0_9BACT|nr:nucleotide exchange factor GrpE [Aliifodinibius salipaludis]PAU95746.1 nucleotide exchange factor GrpE [Aliifodinibius salipaludis]
MSESNEKVTEEQAAEKEQQSAEEQNEAEELYSQYEDFETDELRELLVSRDQEVQKLEEELAEAKDNHLRKAAELENYRKRVQRERSQVYETAKANALEDFLEINDDLQRTLKAAEELEVNDTLMDGVNLVASKFKEVLSKYGVERIDEEGVPFNVDLHDAMMRQKPEDDSIGSDVVLNVVESGYRMGDRTIRHAKVIVSE